MDTRLEQIKDMLTHLKTDSERNHLQMRECLGRTFLLILQLRKKFQKSNDFSYEVKAKIFEIIQNCRSHIGSLYVLVPCTVKGMKVLEEISSDYFVRMNTVIADLEILVKVLENKVLHRKYEILYQKIKEAAERRQNLCFKILNNNPKIEPATEEKRPVMNSVIDLPKFKIVKPRLKRTSTLYFQYLPPSILRKLTKEKSEICTPRMWKRSPSEDKKDLVQSSQDKISKFESQCNLDIISAKTYILGSIHPTSSTGTLSTTIENLPQVCYNLRSLESSCDNDEEWHVFVDDICQTISVLDIESEKELPASIDDTHYQVDPQDLRLKERSCFSSSVESEDWHVSSDDICQTISVLSTESEEELSASIVDPQDLRSKNLNSSVERKQEVHVSLICRTISVLKMKSEVDLSTSIEDLQVDPQDLRSESLGYPKAPIEDQKDVFALSQSKVSVKTYFLRELESVSKFSSTLSATNEDSPSVDNLQVLQDSKTKDSSGFKPPVEDKGVPDTMEKLTSLDKASSINHLWVGKTFGDRRKFLLDWCKKKTFSYGIPMYEFTASWKSGRALVALIHSFYKDLIEDRFLTKESPRNTLTYGEKIARSLGVSCPMDFARECLKQQPSQFTIIPFVEELRSCLESTRVQN